MGSIKSFRDLVAWQKSLQLGIAVHRLTTSFPPHETYGLSSQLRRGAVAVASNIAEGYGRGGRADYVRFLKIARGALYEIDTQLQFALEFGYITNTRYLPAKALLDESERVLAALIRRLDTRAK
jgi:four helix bundle protein